MEFKPDIKKNMNGITMTIHFIHVAPQNKTKKPTVQFAIYPANMEIFATATTYRKECVNNQMERILDILLTFIYEKHMCSKR